MATTIDFAKETELLQCMITIRERFAGRGARYHIKTYGCQMNEHDSEALAGLLEEMEMSPAGDPADAGLIIVNTCCVREHAEVKVHGNIGTLRALKKENPELII